MEASIVSAVPSDACAQSCSTAACGTLDCANPEGLGLARGDHSMEASVPTRGRSKIVAIGESRGFHGASECHGGIYSLDRRIHAGRRLTPP